jgi:hypothetical protein
VNENLLAPDQRTPEWYKNRSGKFTGSRFKDLPLDGGKPKKCYFDLIGQIVVERLTNDFVDSGMDSFALKWGREVEPTAREFYQFETGDSVRQVSFINHPTLSFVGVSPDGLVDPRGGLELKCPKDSSIHIERFETGMNEVEFMPQVQGCMWVCERDWWDWVSSDPRMPPHLRFYRQRVWRDDKYIANLERTILVAEGEVRKRLANYTPERVTQILEQRLNTERKAA